MTARNPRRYRAAAVAGNRRRGPTVRRASAGLSPVRAGAILAMLISAGAIYGLAATPAFGYGHVEIAGTVITPRAAVEAMLGLEKGTNLVDSPRSRSRPSSASSPRSPTRTSRSACRTRSASR